MNPSQTPATIPGAFNLNDVLLIRNHHFKIVLVDGYTGKIALKWITPEEAEFIQKNAASSGSARTS